MLAEQKAVVAHGAAAIAVRATIALHLDDAGLQDRVIMTGCDPRTLSPLPGIYLPMLTYAVHGGGGTVTSVPKKERLFVFYYYFYLRRHRVSRVC